MSTYYYLNAIAHYCLYTWTSYHLTDVAYRPVLRTHRKAYVRLWNKVWPLGSSEQILQVKMLLHVGEAKGFLNVCQQRWHRTFCSSMELELYVQITSFPHHTHSSRWRIFVKEKHLGSSDRLLSKSASETRRSDVSVEQQLLMYLALCCIVFHVGQIMRKKMIPTFSSSCTDTIHTLRNTLIFRVGVY